MALAFIGLVVVGAGWVPMVEEVLWVLCIGPAVIGPALFVREWRRLRK